MTVLAERRDRTILVHTERRDKDLIRQVPGATYDGRETHAWTVPLSWSACLTLRGVFRDRLVVHDTLADWAWWYRQTVVEPAMNLRSLIEADGDPRLYPFQRAGVKFTTHAVDVLSDGQIPFIGKLLTDDMGTGKTVQTIHSAIEYMRLGPPPFPALVVSPNNMKLPWKIHFNEWWPDLNVTVLDGSRAQRLRQIESVKRGDSHVLVANWESLRGHSRLAPYGSVKLRRCIVCDKNLRSGNVEVDKKNRQQFCEWCRRELNHIEWRAIVADEIHRAKGPLSKQTRALFALRTNRTLYRIGLTGTPIADNPLDLWPALHFVDPDAFPTRGHYRDRYCLTTFNPFGGATVIGLKPETRAEFFAITDQYIRRMPKALVLPQLPKKVYVTRYATMSPKQAKAYREMKERMIARVEGDDLVGRVVATNTLERLTRLSQFASSYCELDEAGDVKLAEPSNKLDVLIELLEELDEKPVVVFAQSRQLIDLAGKRLEKNGISHSYIVGGQSAWERQGNIDRFQNGHVRAVLATVQAGGEGITLTRADTMIFLQRSWSMIFNNQGEDRFHRIGAEKHESLTVIDIVAPETVEVSQRDALGGKYDRMQEIVRDEETLARFIDQFEGVAF